MSRRKPPPLGWALLFLAVASIALTLYSFFNVPDPPTSRSTGPQLEDAKISTSTYGKELPVLYGTHRLSGNLIWTTGIDEVAVTLLFKQRVKTGFGRKKTQKSYQTTFLYFSNFAMGVSEGVTEGLLKVFLNNKLIYDATSLNFYAKRDHDLDWFDGGEDQTQLAYSGVGSVQQGATGLPGTGQVVDSIVSGGLDPNLPNSIDLDADAPAYRGLAFCLFDALPLINYGNRIPQASFVVSRSAIPNPYQYDIDLGSPAASDTQYLLLHKFGNWAAHVEFGEQGFARLRWLGTRGHAVQREFVLPERAGVTQTSRAVCCLSTKKYVYVPNESILYKYSSYGTIAGSIDLPGSSEDVGAVMVIPDWWIGGTGFGNLVAIAQMGPRNDVYLLDENTMTGVAGNNDEFYPGPSYPSQFALGEKGSFCCIGASSLSPSGGRPELHFYGASVVPSEEGDEFWNGTLIGLIGRILVEPGNKYDLSGEATPISGFRNGNTTSILLKDSVFYIGQLRIDGTYLILNTRTGADSRIGKWDPFVGDFDWLRDSLGGDGHPTLDVRDYVDPEFMKNTFQSHNITGGVSGRYIPVRGSDNFIRYLDVTTGTLRSGEQDLALWQGDLTSDTVSYDPDRLSLWVAQVGEGANNGPSEILLSRLSNSKTDLDEVVTNECARVGLTSNDIDVTDLAGLQVQGYITSRHGEVRANLLPLMAVYDFGYTESDWILKFRRLDQTPVDTIDEKYIGVGDNKSDADHLSAKRKQENEIPFAVSITYLDTGRDFQTNTHYSRRLKEPVATTASFESEAISLPMSFETGEAASLARRFLARGWTHRNQIATSMLPRYLAYDPLDSVIFVSASETYDTLLTETSVGGGLAISTKGVSNEASVYSLSHPGDEIIFPVPVIDIPAGTIIFALDTNLLFDQDWEALTEVYVVYAQVGYEELNPTSFPGADAWAGFGADVTDLQPWFSTGTQASWGYTSDLLPAPASTQTIDDVNTLTVEMWNGTPESAAVSATATAMENFLARDLDDGGVFAIVGLEVIQAKDVQDNGDGTFTFSNLLRGRRGTDWAVSSHDFTGETVVLLDDLFVSPQPLDTAYQVSYIKAVTRRQVFSDVQPTTKVFLPRSLMPYSPIDIKGERQADNSLVVRWIRRSRVNGEAGWGDGELFDLPLAEREEKYEAVLLSPDSDITGLHDLTSWTEVLVVEKSEGMEFTNQVFQEEPLSVTDNGDGTCRITSVAGAGTYEFRRFQVGSWVRTYLFDNPEMNTHSVVEAVDVMNGDWIDLRIPNISDDVNNVNAKISQVITYATFAEEELISAGYDTTDSVKIAVFQMSALVGRGHPGAEECGP